MQGQIFSIADKLISLSLTIIPIQQKYCQKNAFDISINGWTSKS